MTAIAMAGEVTWRPRTREDIPESDVIARVVKTGVTRVGPSGQTVRPQATPRPHRHHSVRRYWRKAIRMLLAVLFLGGIGVSVSMSVPETTAHAGIIPNIQCMVDSTYNNVSPESVGGESSFLPPNKYYASPSKPGPYTVFERFGMRGEKFSTTTQLYSASALSNKGNARSCSISRYMMNLMAQEVFDVDRFITGSQIGIQERAADSGPLLQIMETMSPTVGKMRDQLFIPGATIMVILSGFWVLFKGYNTRAAITGIGWVFGSLLLVGFLLAPTKLSNTAGSTPVATGKDPNFYWAAATINDTRESALSFIASQVVGSSSVNDPCYLPKGQPNAAQRVVDCRLWQAMVFQPWSQVMFGQKGLNPITGWNPKVKTGQFDGGQKTWSTTGTKDLRIVLLAAQAFSNDGDYLLRGKKASSPPPQNPTPSADGSHALDPNKDQFALYYQVFSKLAPQDHNRPGPNVNGKYGDWDSFRGDNASSRMTGAIGGTVAALLVGAVVVITSLLSLVWNAVPILLLLALPIVGLAAAYPATHKYLRSLMQTWAKSSILGFVFGLVQLLGAVIVSAILSQSNIALGWKCLLLLVLIIAMFRLVKAAQEDAFTPNMGGDNMFDPTEHVTRAGQTTRRTGSNVARVTTRRGGGVLAGATAGAATAGFRGANRGVAAGRNSMEKRRDQKSRVSGPAREQAIKARAASRFSALKPKDREKMTEDERKQRLSGFMKEETAAYDKEIAQQQAEANENRPSRGQRVASGTWGAAKGTASAARTGVAATAKGAAAGGLAARRDRGGIDGLKAGTVNRTGARDGSTRRATRSGEAPTYTTRRDRQRRDEFAAKENARRAAEREDRKPRALKRVEQEQVQEALRDIEVAAPPPPPERARR